MFKKYQKIHFVGIGGIGMSGIAEILLTLGYSVTGSDVKKSETIDRLKRRGALVWIGHEASHVKDAHVVVVSSAVADTNPEIVAAKELLIPLVPRAEMLAELMRIKYGIAVAGTHGKTSTTSLIAAIVDKAGLDPTMIIGGKVKSFKGNARLGKGEFLIAEADESDRSFLKLSPTIGVITNIDPEHLENYSNFEHLQQAFVDFANKVPFYGSVVCCVDHPIVRKIMPKIVRRVITYGESDAEYEARNIEQIENHLSFDVTYRSNLLGRLSLPMAGRHYAKNALAAIAVTREMDIPFNIAKDALENFEGVARRFEVLYNSNPIIVDDYGHHPVEISATILAAHEGWPKRRIVAVIQPHRYTRLHALWNDFIDAMKQVDAVVVMEVYKAGEMPIHGVTGERLHREMKSKYPEKIVEFAPLGEDVMTLLKSWKMGNNLILFLGAGDITKTAHAFANSVKREA